MTVGTDPHLEIAVADSSIERLAARIRAPLGTTAFRSALSVLDQLVVSGSHFVAMVIVGHACGPRQLGDYTLAFTVLTIAICIQQGLISLPFTTYGNYLCGEEKREFSGSTLAHYAAFASILAIGFGLTSAAITLGYGPSEFVSLTLIMALAFPAVLLVEFARGFAIARLEMTTVLVVDVVMTVVRIGGLLVLASLGRLSAEGAFAALGVGAATAGLGWFALGWQAFRIRPSKILADAYRCWRYGSWFVVSQLILAVRASALLWVLVGVLGNTATGVFAACDNIVRLSNPAIIGIRNILFPSAARAFAKGDLHEVRRLLLQSTRGLVALTALACLTFALFGNAVVTRLYGADFAGYGSVITILALAIVVDALDTVVSTGLVAIERPNVSFACNVVGTVVVLALSAALLVPMGILGAAWASLVGRIIQFFLQWIALDLLMRRLATEERT